MNHQAWLTEWSRDGQDLYPRLRAKIATDPENRAPGAGGDLQADRLVPDRDQRALRREYLGWFLRSDAQVERFRLQPLEYIGISEDNVREFEDARTVLTAGGEIELHDEGDAAEYAPQVIHSVLTGTERVIHGNVINRGLIDNLPEGSRRGALPGGR